MLHKGKKERSVVLARERERETERETERERERGFRKKMGNIMCPLSLGDNATNILVTCPDITKMERGIFEQ